MSREHLRILVFALGVTLAASSFAQKKTSLSEADLAGLIRAVNTAQLNWLAKHGTYGSLRDLSTDKLLTARGARSELQIRRDDLATVGGYELRIVVDSEGRYYFALLIPEQGCGAVLFSTEAGVIYRGKAMGCE